MTQPIGGYGRDPCTTYECNEPEVHGEQGGARVLHER
jgi:hypothetical protein